MTRARSWVRASAVAVALAGVCALAACTSSKPSASGSTTSDFSTTATSPVPTDSAVTTPESSTPPSSSIAPSPPATTSATSARPKPPGDGCTIAQLAVRVLRGGAVQQQEIALVTFTNQGTKACTLFGFPGVSLRRNNSLLGKPADRNPRPPTTVKLAPGEQAESQITDFSSCQAPLSDTVRVYPPNSTGFVDKPLDLRGCRIVVDPVQHS